MGAEKNGNDLNTPSPMAGFPGLKPKDTNGVCAHPAGKKRLCALFCDQWHGLKYGLQD